MAEYIEREAVERFIESGLNNPDKAKAFGYDAVCILTEVHYMSAADVVEVVRCKDCKRFLKYTSEYRNERTDGADGDCFDRVMNSEDRQYYGVKQMDFCSYGERRDDHAEP